MDYLVAGLLVLLAVGAGLTLLILSARRHGRRQQRASSDPTYGAGVPGSDTAILAADRESPLGDTSQHAGEQREGETVSGQDAERSGGSGRPTRSGYADGAAIGDPSRRRRGDDPHVARPVVGGEAEGTRRI
ncbi:MAG: hypothetical protein ACRDPC_07990 [Solirubrobacteraceae bacterium]